MIKKFEDFINEKNDYTDGASTVGLLGSGTAVSGYPTGSFTSSSGQAVYGGDSATSFAGNSSGKNIKSEVPIEPFTRFKDIKKKKKKKDKKLKLYNQIGRDIDELHKPSKKTNNENVMSFYQFNSFNEKVNKS